MNTKRDIVDHAAQDANLWLRKLTEKLPGADRHDAYLALRAVLHALRDRVGPENSVHLGAQLPTLIRGIFYEAWRPAGTPTHERHRDEFLAHVGRELAAWPGLDVETAVRAVFRLLWEQIDAGEVQKLMLDFPEDLQVYWQDDRPVPGRASLLQ